MKAYDGYKIKVRYPTGRGTFLVIVIAKDTEDALEKARKFYGQQYVQNHVFDPLLTVLK